MAAAKTPSGVVRESAGSQFKLIATFTDLDDGDTWVSGIDGVRDFYFHDTDNPSTQGSVGSAVAHSAGTFTFYPAEDDKTGDLVVFI